MAVSNLYRMRKTFLLILVCFIATLAEAQVKKKASKEPEDLEFTAVSNEASTDTEAWNKHIRKYSILPDSLRKNIPTGKYVAVVQFIVDKYGNMGDLKVVTDPGYGLGDIAMGIIRTYTGTWKPAVQCGNQVKAYKKQPVIFVVSE